MSHAPQLRLGATEAASQSSVLGPQPASQPVGAGSLAGWLRWLAGLPAQRAALGGWWVAGTVGWLPCLAGGADSLAT